MLRYGLWSVSSRPVLVLASTVAVTAVAFLVAAFLLTTGPLTTARAALFGLCASAASLSAWAVLTIDQTPLMSAAFLTLTPAAAVVGLGVGLLLARSVAR